MNERERWHAWLRTQATGIIPVNGVVEIDTLTDNLLKSIRYSQQYRYAIETLYGDYRCAGVRQGNVMTDVRTAITYAISREAPYRMSVSGMMLPTVIQNFKDNGRGICIVGPKTTLLPIDLWLSHRASMRKLQALTEKRP